MWQPLRERSKQWAARPSRRCPLLFEQTPPPRGASDVNNGAKTAATAAGVVLVTATSRDPVDLQKTNHETLRWVDVTVTRPR